MSHLSQLPFADLQRFAAAREVVETSTTSQDVTELEQEMSSEGFLRLDGWIKDAEEECSRMNLELWEESGQVAEGSLGIQEGQVNSNAPPSIDVVNDSSSSASSLALADITGEQLASISSQEVLFHSHRDVPPLDSYSDTWTFSSSR